VKNLLPKGASALVVDDDPGICSILRKVIPHWGIKVDCITNPLRVIGRLSESFYNVIILDLVMPGHCGLDLIPDITNISPYTKIIIITAHSEKDRLLRALRLGAFDFLEKPFELELLRHSLNNALETQQTELEYMKAYEYLINSRNDVLAHRSSSEALNKQLMETNNALSVLAQNIERTRQEAEKAIIQRIKSSILPIIDKLEKGQNLLRFHGELELLRSSLNGLTSDLTSDTQILSALTSAEFRVVSLINSGFTTDEIAGMLYISPNTVQTHRRNIRKKLNLDNTQQSLRSFLRSKLADRGDPTDPLTMSFGAHP
jgi:DNA-binding NarL/FixJ family response regulator